MWMYLGLLAALFLGLHNLCKKHALQGNEVFPVLLGTISAGFILIVPFYCGVHLVYPDYMQKTGFYITDITWETHGFIAIKSADNGIFMGFGLSSTKTSTHHNCNSNSFCRTFFYFYRGY